MFRKLASIALLTLATASPALADNRAAFNHVDQAEVNAHAECVQKNYNAKFAGSTGFGGGWLTQRYYVGADQSVHMIMWASHRCEALHIGYVGDGTIYLEGDSLAVYQKSDADVPGRAQNGMRRWEVPSYQEHVAVVGKFPGKGSSFWTQYAE